MKEEIFFPKDFDEDMKSYADMMMNDSLKDVDDLIMHLRQALQHNKLVGKRNSFTVFI